MRRAFGWIPLIAVAQLASLAGCGSSRDAYLQEVIGKADQPEIRRELGNPDRIAKKDGGQTLWIYQDCLMLQGCVVWYLSFDRERVLQTWERAPEHS